MGVNDEQNSSGTNMFDVDHESQIKALCKEIAAEKNLSQLNDLVQSLHKTVEAERDETRMRMRLIAQQYRERICSTPKAQLLLEVVSFLGLGSTRRVSDR